MPKNYAPEIQALVRGIADGFDMARAIPKPSEGMVRPAVEIAERKHRDKKARLQILLNAKGRCVLCGKKITGPFEIEHGIPIALGGPDDDASIGPAHVECHAEKTRKRDIPQIAKAKRQHKKSFGERPPGKIQCRGFDRSRRRKMDGTVERVKL